MTGFNVRVVNPGLQPLKSYWIAVEDSGNPGQLWNKVSWSAALTNGCSVEVYVRAADQRPWLGSAKWVQATNDDFFPSLRGRYLEVRLAMTRDDARKQPVLYDLTLYGTSSGFAGDFFLDDARAYETQDAVFCANLVGAEPLGYQWFVMYPWQTNWVQVPGATNSTFAVTNVDSWVDWSMASVLVTNGNGESLWLGPAFVEVWPLPNALPASGSSGPASRYPVPVKVFDQPTNLANVTLTLSGLSHTRSADLNILLVTPANKGIMLMSNVGGTNGVVGATTVFGKGFGNPPPISGSIASGVTSYYQPSNYGQVTAMPAVGSNPPPQGPYSINLNDLIGDDPNGVWRLYIYDTHVPGGVGQITGSWWLDLTFQ